MRPPPPIAWRCDGSLPWRGARAGLAAAAAGAGTAWALGHLDVAWPWILAGPLCAGALATMCVVRWAEDPRGTLSWTGQAWAWQPASAKAPVAVRALVAFDLQSALLLRLVPVAPGAGPTTWLAVSRRQDAVGWPQLCATLLATQGAPDEAA